MKYGTLCPASPAPIRTGSGSNISLTANTACGPANPVAEKASSSTVLSIANTITDCNLPSELPVFDKQALVGNIPAENTTTGTLNCFGNSGKTFEFPGNHRHVGNLDFGGDSCNGKITSGGVLYIDGSLNIGWGSYLEVDPSVTEPVTVVVNGRVIVYNGRLGTSGLPKLNLIMFYSVNNACSSSPTCNSLSMKDLYDSARSVNHNMLIHHSSTNVYANLYAPFSTIRFTTSPKVETSEIYGQKVEISHGHLGSFTVAP